ncbi:hydrolase [Bacillus sp. SA1-12]|uniref:alpha/beta fold hydrolase n=1 Tax=Bacillus sp. SA1-12 TaxID=1455638 RepID=UPI0006253A12|nr:alpha/beta hydrolase [Bacillus sp. SA1-12]KKI92962.1 hydrolase [Bacillus sp. SA1-12]
MDLYYEIHGEGHPVVLIHSGGADLRQWSILAPLLAENYKVISYDGRGAGKSPSPNEYADYIEDLRSLMDDLNLNKATLIGHNIGGQIATDFALVYPERVTQLVLITPSLTGFRYSQEAEQYIKNVIDAAPQIDKMIDVFLNTPAYQAVSDSPQRELIIEMLRHHMQRMLKWPVFKTIWPEPPSIDRLQDLKPKTLYIIGLNEELADHFVIADYFKKVPNIQFIEIEDANHIMIALTHPEQLHQEITAFMEECKQNAKNT